MMPRRRGSWPPPRQQARYHEDTGGCFYVIHLVPELTDRLRIKLGFTRNLTTRLAQLHKGGAPTARVLATYPCEAISDERLAIKHINACLDGWEMGGEVFDYHGRDVSEVVTCATDFFGDD